MKHHFRLVPLLLLAVVLVVGLLAAGCGDSEEPAETTAAPTETTAAPTETTAAPTETTAAPTETSAPSGETITLRLPMGQPDGDPLVVPVVEMAEKFNARAGGAYEIQVYTASSLVAPPEALDACRTGAVEMASICYPIYASVDERLSIIELPVIFDNMAALEAAHNEKMVALYDSITSEKFNQKTLGMNHVGFNELIGTKPLKTLDDWKGMLIGVASPIAIDMMQELGAQTVVIDWTESYSNLDKKVVDHLVAGTQYMWIAELYKPGKYSTWMQGTAPHYGITVNLDVWNAMPADMQQILAEEVMACCVEMNEVHSTYWEPNKQKLEDGGCEVFVPSDEERAKWKAECDDYVAEKVASFGDFGAEFMAIVDEANAAVQ